MLSPSKQQRGMQGNVQCYKSKVEAGISNGDSQELVKPKLN